MCKSPKTLIVAYEDACKHVEVAPTFKGNQTACAEAERALRDALVARVVPGAVPCRTPGFLFGGRCYTLDNEGELMVVTDLEVLT